MTGVFGELWGIGRLLGPGGLSQPSAETAEGRRTNHEMKLVMNKEQLFELPENLAERCQATYGWDPELTHEILYGYRQFIKMKQMLSDWDDEKVLPSARVKSVWKLHLQYTKQYRMACQSYCESMVDLDPDKGFNESQRLFTQETLERHFGDQLDEAAWSGVWSPMAKAPTCQEPSINTANDDASEFLSKSETIIPDTEASRKGVDSTSDASHCDTEYLETMNSIAGYLDTAWNEASADENQFQDAAETEADMTDSENEEASIPVVVSCDNDCISDCSDVPEDVVAWLTGEEKSVEAAGDGGSTEASLSIDWQADMTRHQCQERSLELEVPKKQSSTRHEESDSLRDLFECQKGKGEGGQEDEMITAHDEMAEDPLDYRQRVAALEAELRQRAADKKSWDLKFADVTAKYENEVSSRQDLEKSNVELVRELQECKSRKGGAIGQALMSAGEKLQKCQRESDEYDSLVKELRHSNQHLKSDLSRSEGQCSHLGKEVSTLHAEHLSVLQEKDTVQANFDVQVERSRELRTANEEMVEKLTKSHEKEKIALDAKLKTASETIAKLRQSELDLRQDLRVCKEAKAHLDLRLGNIGAELQQTQQKKVAMHTKRNSEHQSFVRLREANQAIKNDLEMCRAERNALQANLKQQVANGVHFDSLKGALEKDLRRCQLKSKNLHWELEMKVKDNIQLSKTIMELEQENWGQKEAFQTRCDNYAVDLREYQRNNALLQTKLRRVSGEKAQFKEEIAAVKNKLMACQHDREKITAKLKKEQTTSGNKKKLVLALQSKLKEYESANDDLRAKLNENKTAPGAKRTNLQEEIVELNEKLSASMKHNNELASELSAAQYACKKSDSLLEDANASLDRVTIELACMQTKEDQRQQVLLAEQKPVQAEPTCFEEDSKKISSEWGDSADTSFAKGVRLEGRKLETLGSRQAIDRVLSDSSDEQSDEGGTETTTSVFPPKSNDATDLQSGTTGYNRSTRTHRIDKGATTGGTSACVIFSDEESVSAQHTASEAWQDSLTAVVSTDEEDAEGGNKSAEDCSEEEETTMRLAVKTASRPSRMTEVEKLLALRNPSGLRAIAPNLRPRSWACGCNQENEECANCCEACGAPRPRPSRHIKNFRYWKWGDVVDRSIYSFDDVPEVYSRNWACRRGKAKLAELGRSILAEAKKPKSKGSAFKREIEEVGKGYFKGELSEAYAQRHLLDLCPPGSGFATKRSAGEQGVAFANLRENTCDTHIDQLMGFLLVLSGRKQVWLAPPSVLATLRSRGLSDQESNDYFSAVKPFSGDFCYTDKGKWQMVELGPGDGLVIPTNWLHSVKSFKDTVGVSMKIDVASTQ